MEQDTFNKEKTATKKHPFRGRSIHHGINIRMLREMAQMNQKGLGDKLNKSQQYVSEIESKEILDDETIQAVAKALNVDPQYITDWITDNAQNIFNIDKMGEGEGSTNMVGTNNFETNHEVHIYPIDKVCQLFERLIEEKQERISELEKMITKFEDYQQRMEKEITSLKEKISNNDK